ncbi:MAG: phosphate ABC transporter permease PstA [Candidatus Lokiarchaeota archaeon]|nr:phosphate ABC transporter permease PstA [Candidatus Lokiarchaeota archaeon]
MKQELVMLGRKKKGFSMKVFNERFMAGVLGFTALVGILSIFFILAFLIKEGYPIFTSVGGWTFQDFITGKTWYPIGTPPQFGALPMITGTLLLSLVSMAIAVPIGIGCALFIAVVLPPKLKDLIKSMVEILSGIPSVVWGFFGMRVVIYWVRSLGGVASGNSLLAGAILIAFMALPTIVSVSEDAISVVARDQWEASLALGATKWQTIKGVILPNAFSGIAAAVILGIGRALGETMAVIMVCGNSPVVPDEFSDIFNPILTITATLGIEMAEVPYGSDHFTVLYGLAILLFLIVLGTNIVAGSIIKHLKKKTSGDLRKDVDEQKEKRGWKYTVFLLAQFIFASVLSEASQVYAISGMVLLMSGAIITLLYSAATRGRSISGVVRIAVKGALAGLAGFVVAWLCDSVVLIWGLVSLCSFLALKGAWPRITRFWSRSSSRVVSIIQQHWRKAALFSSVFLLVAWASNVVFAMAAMAAIAGVWLLSRRVNPRVDQRIATAIITASAAVVLGMLVLVVAHILSRGLPHVSWEFLSQSPKDLNRAGGIFPAIVGSLYLVGGAILFALPIGVCAAIFLNEYAKESKLKDVIRAGIDNLNGTPSIIFGLFGFTCFVLFFGFGRSMLAGMLTLGLMILPTIIRTTEESLRAIPHSVREGSLALGATKWQTIQKVVVPTAVPGTLTGAILSIGRAIGETAPILFTAATFTQRFLPDSVFDPVMTLSNNLFILATEIPYGTNNAYATAVVLLFVVLVLYSTASIIRYLFKKHMSWSGK